MSLKKLMFRFGILNLFFILAVKSIALEKSSDDIKIKQMYSEICINIGYFPSEKLLNLL